MESFPSFLQKTYVQLTFLYVLNFSLNTFIFFTRPKIIGSSENNEAPHHKNKHMYNDTL